MSDYGIRHGQADFGPTYPSTFVAAPGPALQHRLDLQADSAGPNCLPTYNSEEANLIYTAITRGKKLVVVVGSKRALAMSVRNDKTQKRYTNLRLRLGGTGGEGWGVPVEMNPAR